MSREIDDFIKSFEEPYGNRTRREYLVESERELNEDYLSKRVMSFEKSNTRFALMHNTHLGNSQISRALRKRKWGKKEIPNSRLMHPKLMFSELAIVASTLAQVDEPGKKGVILTTVYSYGLPFYIKRTAYRYIGRGLRRLLIDCLSKIDIPFKCRDTLSNYDYEFVLRDEEDWARKDLVLKLQHYATYRDQALRELMAA